jgi:hypothetical protein
LDGEIEDHVTSSVDEEIEDHVTSSVDEEIETMLLVQWMKKLETCYSLPDEIGRHVTLLDEEIEDHFASLDISIKECYFMLIDWMKNMSFWMNCGFFFFRGQGLFY